ncbi:hypothetical protein [Mesorhizobium sp. CAU 1741]|uniref:glycosyltransferase n=1 Tax=Mesorhizobium sp. CAU 1741 TaxID=3140366 RepID=UPI00325AB6B1
METVTGYVFEPGDLRAGERPPGVSAFMRIRNGADFLEATIRTHIDAFDEIVAVHNQCTDATPDILARLAQEYGPKLRVFHYLDRVHPPGSAAHAAEPANSPHSLVNYYNFALSRTRYAYATKLDDDHLAITELLRGLCDSLRTMPAGSDGVMHCFSGLNLARDTAGTLVTPATSTISGTGDIGFFQVSPDTWFRHDRRYERFHRGGLKREFSGFLYWHLKYLKQGEGFANYELESNPDGRYWRQLGRLRASPMLSLPQLRATMRPTFKDRVLAAVSEKRRVVADARASVPLRFPQGSFEQALDATSPGWRTWLDVLG